MCTFTSMTALSFVPNERWLCLSLAVRILFAGFIYSVSATRCSFTEFQTNSAKRDLFQQLFFHRDIFFADFTTLRRSTFLVCFGTIFFPSSEMLENIKITRFNLCIVFSNIFLLGGHEVFPVCLIHQWATQIMKQTCLQLMRICGQILHQLGVMRRKIKLRTSAMRKMILQVFIMGI